MLPVTNQSCVQGPLQGTVSAVHHTHWTAPVRHGTVQWWRGSATLGSAKDSSSTFAYRPLLLSLSNIVSTNRFLNGFVSPCNAHNSKTVLSRSNKEPLLRRLSSGGVRGVVIAWPLTRLGGSGREVGRVTTMDSPETRLLIFAWPRNSFRARLSSAVVRYPDPKLYKGIFLFPFTREKII